MSELGPGSLVPSGPNRAARRAAGRRARQLAALGSGAVLASGAGAAVVSFTSSPAAALSTFTVTTGGDAGDGTCDVTCTLRDAMEDANADAEASEIVFAANVTGTITLTDSLDVYAGGDLTVTGPGANVLTINANAVDTIFYSDGDWGPYTLSISGLTLTNGDRNRGGAIKFYDIGTEDKNLVLTNMVITDNHADSDGGGIALYNVGDLTVTNTTISGNDVESDDGGGIYFYDSGSATITNSTISGNITDNNGGGIFFYESVSMTVTGSTISQNTTRDDDGGGIFFYNSDNLTITSSTLSGNTAADDGGGLNFYDSDNLTVTASTVSGNTSGDDGGGLYVYADGTTTIANSTIANNTAAEVGGGIAFPGVGDLLLLQTTISGNTAGTLGDGLYLDGYDAAPAAQDDANASGKGERPAEPKGTAEDPKPDKPAKPAKVATQAPDVGALEAQSVQLIGTIISANPGNDIDTDSDAPIPVESTSSLIGTTGAQIAINDLGGTIRSSAPGLAALASNGGPTQTMALVVGSAAIDTGPATVPVFPGNENDQRGAGFSRVVNGRVDIGAYEFRLVVRFAG